MQPILILGTGLAGYNVARELRKLDQEAPLAIMTRDDGSFYSKPMLSNAIATGKSAAALAMKDASQMASELNAEILTHVKVTAIDTAGHQVIADGQARGYSKLVLALGADPFTPPIAGDGAGAALSVNDLGDYARFRLAVAERKRVVILGAGLIGCEFANDLLSANHEVEVVDLAPLPLGRLLPTACGEAVRDALAGAGVSWQLGVKPVAVERAGERLVVVLDNGARLTAADVVLSAIGLRPRTAMAQAAGIQANRGIVTDRLLQTSAPDVYALGDCAEVSGLVLPFVMPIMHAARALAKTLAGSPTPVSYPAMPVVVKTPALATVVAPPLPGLQGEWQVEQVEGGIKALFVDVAGSLAGFALTGSAVAEKNALAQRIPPWLL